MVRLSDARQPQTDFQDNTSTESQMVKGRKHPLRYGDASMFLAEQHEADLWKYGSIVVGLALLAHFAWQLLA
jgi:hypothetical protein